MKQSSQFSVSVHILTLLYFAKERKESLSSEYIAGSVNTNPVVIRKLIAKLKAAKLVDSVKGAGGGAVLLADVKKTTLWDIFCAVEDTRILNSSYTEPNPACSVGRNIQGVLEDLYIEVDLSVQQTLQKKSLFDIVSKFT